jgi:hypothetical protein
MTLRCVQVLASGSARRSRCDGAKSGFSAGCSAPCAGKPIYSLYCALITKPSTIALYFSLIPLLDATGAALAFSVSYGVGLLPR